jgi:MFS family permease
MFKRIGQKTTNFFITVFYSLKHKYFRIFWVGQCVSLIGTFMQRTAQYWLVYSITKSPLLVGLLGVCQFLPMLLFSLFAGAIVDRISKKKLIFITQSLFLLQASALALLTFTGSIQYWHVLVLSSVYGVSLTLDMPARHSFIFDLVGKDDILNAISLNSTIINLAKIIGPAAAGILMLHLGIELCFLLNALSYIAVIISLLFIHTEKTMIIKEKVPIFKEIIDGLRYIKASQLLIINVIIFGIVSTFAMNNDVIIPVFAQDVLNKGADGYSLLLTAAGIGSLAGALLMASRSKNGVNMKLLFIGSIGTALLQIALCFTVNYMISLILICIVGFINLVFFNTANSLFQTNTSDEYRGRVMSVYSLLNQGSTPVGNFFAGTAMEHFGGAAGYLLCGVATLLFLLPIFIFKRNAISSCLKNNKNSI